mmetsp:Transcript_20939/g.29386  ORF Transcript_20939/g.29386 Transcript_20939/m.29386 type:complete len:278 (-) Transcript_20939:1627-2460(-)
MKSNFEKKIEHTPEGFNPMKSKSVQEYEKVVKELLDSSGRSARPSLDTKKDTPIEESMSTSRIKTPHKELQEDNKKSKDLSVKIPKHETLEINDATQKRKDFAVTTSKQEVVETPKSSKAVKSKQSFSLAKMMEAKKNPSQSGLIEDTVKSKMIKEVELPEWLIRDPPIDIPKGDNSEERCFALEFLLEALKGFQKEKINMTSIARELECAIFEIYKRDSKMYWDRVHAIVGAIAGKKNQGILANKIISGEYSSPTQVATIDEKKLLLSFEGICFAS